MQIVYFRVFNHVRAGIWQRGECKRGMCQGSDHPWGMGEGRNKEDICPCMEDGEIVRQSRRKRGEGAIACSARKQARLKQVTAGVNYSQVLLG